MSRIGKLPIKILEKTQIEILGQTVKASGPLGELVLKLPSVLKVERDGDFLLVKAMDADKTTRSLWGLWRTLLNNAIIGVSLGFTKELEMVGLGYKAQKTTEGLDLFVGFSHVVKFVAPKNITLAVDKNLIKVSGFDKQLVGEIAAQIRRIKPPEPYKGKGIRYLGEKVLRKAGKATKVATPGK